MTQAITYVQETSKPKKLAKFIVYGSFFVGIPALLIIGTATKPERLDMAKEQILEGKKLTEIDTQQKKIRQAKYAIAYYCEDNPNDEKCPKNDYNDDRRMNPLGDMKQVSYEPKKYQRNAFSWKADIAPPMPKSGLGQQVRQVKQTVDIIKTPKSKTSHDRIGAVIAENNIRSVINRQY